MYKIAVCDNQEDCLEIVKATIKQYCEKNKIEIEVRYFNDSDALMDLVEGKKLFDVYFLDVDMPCYSGIDLVKKIRELTALPIIVLLTGFERYAIQACGMDIFRYVLKQKWDVEAKPLLNDLFFRLSQRNENKIYVIQNSRRYVKIFQKEIMYIVKDQKYAIFTLTEKRKETERLALQQVFNKLNDPCMYFFDRGIILNIHHIGRVEEDKVTMDDGKTIFGGEENVRQLKRYLCTYWGDFT